MNEERAQEREKERTFYSAISAILFPLCERDRENFELEIRAIGTPLVEEIPTAASWDCANLEIARAFGERHVSKKSYRYAFPSY